MSTTVHSGLTENDIITIMEIEFKSFEYPWGKVDFQRAIKKSKHAAIRHQATKKIVAYMFYVPDDEFGVEITSLAVDPAYRRQGLAKRLVNVLMDDPKYNNVYASVREGNLDGQLFLKAMGLKCTEILSDVYENHHELAYFFHKDK